MTDLHHEASAYLYILKPRLVFAARLNVATPSYPLAQIDYTAVTTGAYSDLEMGMLLCLGSAPGKWDLGRTYLRGTANSHTVATSTLIYVGFCSRGHNNGELDLQDGGTPYISVYDVFLPWKRPSRMLTDGSLYKDYDWAVTAFPSPVACVGDMGGLGRMGFVDGLGYLTISGFNAGLSYPTDNAGGVIVMGAWDMKDGSYVSGSSSSLAPVVKFPPGARYIKLDMNSSLAQAALPRRYLVIALDGEDDPNLIQTARMASWHLGTDGATLQAELRQRLDPDGYLPGSPVFLLVKEAWDGVAGSKTGFDVKFAGFLQYNQSFAAASITDFERATTIHAMDLAQWMKTQTALASTIQRTSSWTTFFQMLGANIPRYVFWYLFLAHNALMLTDFFWDGTDYDFTTFASSGSDYYTVLDNLSKAIALRLTSDSRGRFRMLPDPERLNPVDRTTVVMAALDEDTINRVERTARPFPRQGILRATATLVSTKDAGDATTAPTEVNVIAPGLVEGQASGDTLNSYPWHAQSLTEAEERLGHDYERDNAQEDALLITLAHGGDLGIEPANMEWITVTITAETVGWMNETLSNTRLLPSGVDFVFDDDAGTMTQTITAERETVGTPGAEDPRPVPGNVPTPTTVISPPALPPVPLATPYNPVPSYTGDTVPTRLIIFDDGGAHCHVATAWNPTALTITYTDASTGLTGNNIWSCSDPWNYKRYFALQTTGLFKNDDPFGGGSWTLVASNATMFGGGASNLGKFIAMSINRQGYIATISGNMFTYTTDYGVTWHNVAVDGGAPAYATGLGANTTLFSISPYNNGGVGWIYCNVSGAGLYKSTDWGASWTLLVAVTTVGADFAVAMPSVPYIRTDGTTPNINDASQEVWSYKSTIGGGNGGFITLSKSAGLTGTWVTQWSQATAGSYFIPAITQTGWNFVPFTYDGSIVMINGTNNSSKTHLWTAFFGHPILTKLSDHDYGTIIAAEGQQHVNGYPVHSQAGLFWNQNDTTLRWSLDAGVNYFTASAPAGYAGISYVEWNLAVLVPPPGTFYA